MSMRRIMSLVLTAGLTLGTVGACTMPVMAEGAAETETARTETAGTETVKNSENSAFLPIAVAEEYPDYRPESVSDRLNENGQLPVAKGFLYCSGTYQKLRLTGDGAAEYPELAARIDELNENMEQNGKLLIDANWQGAEAACNAGFNENEYAYYTSSADLVMNRMDEKVLSFMRHDVWNRGMPYPSDRKEMWSIDPKTGQDLTVADVFTDPDAVHEMLKQNLERVFPADYTPELYNALESFFAGEAPQGITMAVGYENITFCFAPEVASTTESVIEYLSYSVLGSAVNEAYTGHQTNYVTDVICDSYFTGEFSADLNGDGEPVHVLTYASEDEYNNITGAVLSWNGQEMSYPLYAYHILTRLVRTEDGRYYLYTDALSDNDWHETYVVKYEDGAFVSVGDLQGSTESRYEYEDELVPWIMMDPEHFSVTSRAQTLSTVGISRSAKLGEDGMPEYTEPYWMYTSDFKLTLKTDLEADVVDPDGNVATTATLPAGTALYMFRTDLAGNEDLRDSEGNIYRVYLNAEDWPRTVNGIELEQAFDGVMFAG